nr:histidinol dehydrogenase [Microbacterium sp.]
MGGAQAVAALAYGTESVPKVDKIVGPGTAQGDGVAHAARASDSAAMLLCIHER